MTVRDAVRMLVDANTLYIGWDGNITLLDKDNRLMMDAFGSYKVGEIRNVHGKDGCAFELTIAATPMKEAI